MCDHKYYIPNGYDWGTESRKQMFDSRITSSGAEKFVGPIEDEYNGIQLKWEKPICLYHAAEPWEVYNILSEGLLYLEKSEDSEGIYLFDNRVPPEDMTGRKRGFRHTILKVEWKGIRNLHPDMTYKLDLEWHKENPDPYPEHQFVAKQKRIDPKYISVIG